MGGGRDNQRKKQTPNSLFSLSNSNHSEGRGWREGGEKNEEEHETG